ncbi:amino acid permease, partial [Streptomyces sp. TRM76130]|nr:amino acid permease [Streptomyces sp. TRM76130]
GTYAWPERAHAVAVASVVALTAVDYAGVRRSAWLTRGIVAVVLLVLAAVVAACLAGGTARAARLAAGADAG